ncbi:hypothetical protein [Saccharopolyspora taberi]|uniref:Uncharacterized protein n=1 Tax=Saccharopolyspora taberi TaxID=60895 RepID=A0ABN3VP22_9PSEU
MSTDTKERNASKRDHGSSRTQGTSQETQEITAKPRVNLAERASTWEPDLRWFAPFVAVQVLYVVGCIPYFTALSYLLMIPVGLAITAAAWLGARNAFEANEYGEQHIAAVTKLILAAGSTSTGWLAFAGTTTPLDPAALGLLALWGVVFGSLWASLHGKAPERKEMQQEYTEQKKREVEEHQHERKISHKVEQWQPIIHRAGLKGLTVYDWEESKAGDTLYLMDSPDEPVKLKGIEDAIGTIASIAAHELAHQGVKLSAGQVRVEEGDAAHLFKLHISTKQRFSKSIPYPLDRPMQSIEQPIRPAVFEDGEDVLLTVFGAHMFMCGASGSGKDVFTNNVHAEIGNTTNCKTWVGGTAKLMPQVWPWLAPWLRGQTSKPALDRIAGEDPAEVGQMLADLYKIGTLRNKKLGPLSKHKPTAKDPAYFMTLVEASDFLRDHDDMRIKTFDGRTWSPSKLADVLTRAFRSAGVMLFCASQYGLMDGSGSHGSFMMRNFTIRICGKTMSHSDGTNTLVGLKGTDTTKLRDYTLLVQQNIENPRTMPAKAHVLDGEEQIAPIAIRNANQSPATTPQWIEDALGSKFANRWSAKYHPELVEICHELGLSWPANPNLSSDEPGTVNEYSETEHDQDDDHDHPNEDKGDESFGDHVQMSEKEIQAMMDHAETKFAEANENLKKYGILGETMHHVYEVVMAENAPAWIPAGQLAFVIDRVSEGGDWEAAGQKLASELSGKPWNLTPEERDGQIGWARDTIRATVQAFVEGAENPVTGEVPAQRNEDAQPIPEAQHPLLHAASVVQHRQPDEMVTTGELARLMSRFTDDQSDGEKRSATIRLGRELGQFVKAERGRNGSAFRVRDIIDVAAGVAA